MARTNLCPNPGLKNNATDFFGNGARVTGVTNLPRTTAYQNANSETTCPRGSVTAGVTYRFSAYIKGNGGNTSGSANINWYAGGTYLSSAPGVPFTVNDGQVTRVESGARVAPAGATQGLLNITGLDSGTQVTAILYSPSAALSEFFDGDSPNGAWTGTDGNSTSTSSEGDDDTDTPPPENPGGDPGSSDIAGITQGWGTPFVFDDFNYTGAPNSSWSLYNGPGHVGNGVRRPERWSVANSILRCTGLSGSPNTGGAATEYPGSDRQYGRWEVRMRAYNPGGGSGEQYHPVLIIWPSSENWPDDGEYDFLENDIGDTTAGCFIHYPHPENNGIIQQEHRTMAGIRVADWHNYAFAWYPSGLIGYIDGREWYRMSGGGGPAGRRDIQTMPQGSLRIQLDAFSKDSHREAVMDIDWVRIWTHTSVSLNANIAPAGIPAPTAFGSALIGNRFRMYLNNAAGSTTNTVSSAWDQTSGAVTGRQLGLGRSGANAAIAIAETSTSNVHDVLQGQWISEPMTSGGTLQGAFGFVVARNESSTDANLVSHLVLKVVSGDGTVVRGTAADLVTPIEWGTTLQAISISSTISTPVTCLVGDRLVLELGYRATNVVATSFTGTIRYGGVNDLEANDTGSNATTLAPWINFADRRVEALFRGQTVLPTGIASGQSFGTAVITHPPTQDIAPSGVVSAQALGSPTVIAQAAIVAPTGFTHEAFGTAKVNQNVVLAAGIASGEAIGSHRVRRVTDIYLEAGIPSGEALGALTLVYFQELFPSGVLSGEAFGSTDVEDPHRRIFCTGIPSGAAVGIPGGSIYRMRTRAIASGEAFGHKRLAVKLGRWKLVNPTVTDRYRLGGPRNWIYVQNVRGITVLGTGSTLTAVENPTTEQITSAQYVWLGGHDNITDSSAIRDLWVANGFSVEMVF